MGKQRSRSTKKEEDDGNSMEPNDGVLSDPKSSRKSTFRDRWRKYGGGGGDNNKKEWMNGCGGGIKPSTDNLEEPDDHFGPPMLTIEVDPTKEIDLTHRERPKTEAQMAQEFASAAREAVRLQMKELGNEECLDHDECGGGNTSDGSTAVDVIDASMRSLPPPNMNPTSLLESFGTAKVRQRGCGIFFA